VQPAAGDSGGCLGAAALAWVEETGKTPEALRHIFLGPRWSGDEVARLLAPTGLPALDFRGREGDLVAAVADRLAEGRVVGWFHGAMELGPRALGARSILADPRDPGVRERLNAQVKRREAFRPFAPSVLAAEAAAHLDLDHPSPFMLETCAVASPLALPAVTHVDGSARPQTVDPETAPRFAALLRAFGERTGCPLLVNTSFNVAGEPIVCSPGDALLCFGVSGLDTLVLEEFVLDREAMPANWPALLEVWRERPRSGFADPAGGIGPDLYTFV
jgi:carbamoyltransferase